MRTQTLHGLYTSCIRVVYELYTTRRGGREGTGSCIRVAYNSYTTRIQLVYNSYTTRIQRVVYELYTSCMRRRVAYNSYTTRYNALYELYTSCIRVVYELYTSCMRGAAFGVPFEPLHTTRIQLVPRIQLVYNALHTTVYNLFRSSRQD